MRIVERIARDKQYLPLCQKYAKVDWKRDELHQEFLYVLCKKEESELKEAQDGGYLDWYCFNIIWNLWANSRKMKPSNVLYELAGHIEVEEVQSEEYFDAQPYLDKAKGQIQNDINSDDMIMNFSARIFAYSIGFKIDNGIVADGGKFKSIRQFSAASKIPMSAAHSAFVRYKKVLKQKLKI